MNTPHPDWVTCCACQADMAEVIAEWDDVPVEAWPDFLDAGCCCQECFDRVTPKTWDEIPGYLESMKAEPWKFNWIWQRPTVGSRWYRGNFTLGLMIDSHPRFVHFIIGLLFIEVGVSWKKR